MFIYIKGVSFEKTQTVTVDRWCRVGSKKPKVDGSNNINNRDTERFFDFAHSSDSYNERTTHYNFSNFAIKLFKFQCTKEWRYRHKKSKSGFTKNLIKHSVPETTPCISQCLKFIFQKYTEPWRFCRCASDSTVAFWNWIYICLKW